MKKLTKLLSVFLIAGAVGTGAAGIAACSPKQPETPHEHTAATEWQSDANGHWKNCTANDGAKLEEGAHADGNNDGKCDTCQYQMTTPATGFVVPAGTDSLVIEGVTEEVTLSTTNTSHTIDKTAIKVYLSAKGVKGTEVPAANYDLELYLNGETKVTEWTGLKQDADYVVVAILKDAVDEGGKTVELEGEITVTVNNAIVSLALKTGTLTQVQGANTMTADWTFEATRANGDKEDIAAADVEIGTMDTNTVGENKEVTITLKGTAVTGKVTYSVTADESKVSQAYALNFSYLTTAQETAIKNGEIVSLQDGRFVIQSTTSGSVDSHNKEYNGKYFVKRLKVNGASANKSGCSRYIKVKADGAGTITVIAYNNSGAVGDGASRGVELYSARTADPAGDTYSGKICETVAVPSKEHATGTFTIPAAGEYYITCNNAMTFAYVQLDQLVSAGEGVEEVKLAGEVVVSKIEVTKPETVTNFKVGATFTHEGYTVKATGVNNVTCVSSVTDVTADAEFVAPDMTTIGKKTVTVNYGSASTTYNVIVESAVDGIYGATASLATTLNTQAEGADGTVLVKKSDVLVALVGENAAATSTYTVTYGDSDTELTDEGAQFAIGSHTLKVAVAVTDGTNNDTINVEVALSVTQKIEGELTTLATYTVGLAASAITNTAPDKVTVTNNGTTLDNNNYKFGSNSNSLVLDIAGLKAGQQIEITINCKSGSSSSAVTVSATVSGSATGTFTSDALTTSYAGVAAGAYTVSADGTVSITIVRGGATLRLASVTVVVKGVA